MTTTTYQNRDLNNSLDVWISVLPGQTRYVSDIDLESHYAKVKIVTPEMLKELQERFLKVATDATLMYVFNARGLAIDEFNLFIKRHGLEKLIETPFAKPEPQLDWNKAAEFLHRARSINQYIYDVDLKKARESIYDKLVLRYYTNNERTEGLCKDMIAAYMNVFNNASAGKSFPA